MKNFNLPDLGEGLTEVTVVAWRVAVGDTVAVDQIVVEVETAKSLVEVPVPFAGTVTATHGAPGDELTVGAPLIEVNTGAEVVSPTAEPGTDAHNSGERGQSYREEERAGSGNVLVGYGTSEDTGVRRARRRKPGSGEARPATGEATPGSREARSASPRTEAVRVVNPLVRKVARDAGVDLGEIKGTGPGGLLMRADVLAAVGNTSDTETGTREPDGDKPGTHKQDTDALTGLRVARRTELTGVRRAIADKLATSRRVIPEATVWVDCDVTELLAWRSGLTPYADGRVPSVLAIVGRFVTAGLRRVPVLNSRVEETAAGGLEVVELEGVNLSIAVNTDRGLMVPGVADAHLLSVRQLDAAIRALVEKTRAGKAAPAELTRGTVTLNNYGMFNVDGSAAIINYPQVAIVGMGRIKERPWVVDGELAVRQIMELTLAFDHRVCDGGEASEFLRFVADSIENPQDAFADL